MPVPSLSNGPWPKIKVRPEAPPEPERPPRTEAPPEPELPPRTDAPPEPELPPRRVYEDQYREPGRTRYKSHSQFQRLANRRQEAVAEEEKETRAWHKKAFEFQHELRKAQEENEQLQKLYNEQNAELECYRKNVSNIEEKDKENQSLQAKIAILRKRNIYLETEWQLEVNELKSKLAKLEQLRRQQYTMFEAMRQRVATQLVTLD